MLSDSAYVRRRVVKFRKRESRTVGARGWAPEYRVSVL